MNRPSLLDPSFKYTPHDKTDIRVLFDRVRAELKQQQPKQSNVQPLRKQGAK